MEEGFMTLLVVLLISHVVVLIVIGNYIQRYKKNNHNYIDTELKQLRKLFKSEADLIKKDVEGFIDDSSKSLSLLRKENNRFTTNQQVEFKNTTEFIKKDYKSLSKMLNQNNDMLSALLQKTDENIIKNNELRPILVSSHKELEKIYGKVKLLTTNYEKNLEDLKVEVRDSLNTVENILQNKIRKLAVNGEKIMLDSIENSKTTIEKVTNETNAGLKKVLKENQITLLSENMKISNEDLATSCQSLKDDIHDLYEKLTQKLEKIEKTNSKKNSRFTKTLGWLKRK
jgi:hypothetical protein